MDIFGSVCLIPAKADEIFLDRIIKELAQKYGSIPSFRM
jgi:hypothetical protein